VSSILDWIGRKVEDLVALGYPESVAKRISSGELPMDEASRMARAAEQGYDARTYFHGGDPSITAFDPSISASKKTQGTGSWVTDDPLVANTYLPENGGLLYPLRIRSEGMPKIDAEGSTWSHIVNPNGGTVTTDQLAKAAGKSGESGLIFDNVVDPGTNFKMPREAVDDWLDWRLNYESKGGRNIAVQDPSAIKSVNAAFDPEYKGPNIMGLDSKKVGPDLAGKAIDSAASNAPGFLDSLLSKIQSDQPQQVLDTTYYGDDSMGEDKGKDYTAELNKIADMPAEMWDSMKTREKVALVTSAVPFVGAATGVYADVMNMIEDPEERTLVNSMLLASNFIPASKVARMADKLGITESYNKAKSALIGPDGRPIDEYLHMSKPGESKMVLGETGYDPRYIQGKRKGDVPIMAETEIVREGVGNQILNKLRPEDLAGRGFVTSMADRTAAGGKVTEINGVKLNRPVDLHGGQGYALNNPDKAWASATGVVSSMLNKGKVIADETGMNPILAPFIMAPTGNDFATKTGTVMLSYAEAAMNKTQKKALNRAMKKIDKAWPGVDDPMADSFFENMKPAKRKAAQNMMDKEFREKGGLSLSQARAAVSDASQLNAPDLSLMNLMEYDPSLGRLPSTNPSYDDSLRGGYMGTVQGGFNATDIVPGYKAQRGFDDFTKLSGADKANEAYSFRQTAPVGIFTNQILDEMLKRGAFD
jgi:hypothetical protein